MWPGKLQVGARRRAEARQHLLELEQSRRDPPPNCHVLPTGAFGPQDIGPRAEPRAGRAPQLG